MSEVQAVSQRVQLYRKMPPMKTGGGDGGGTKWRLGVVNHGVPEGDPVTIMVSNCPERVKLEREVSAAIREFASGGVTHMAIGFPCPVKDGEPYYTPPNMGYNLVGFLELIRQKTGIDIRAINDANGQCIGEAYVGAGIPFERVAFHGIGTGYGFAFMVGDTLILPEALEGGHVRTQNLYHSSREGTCGCGGVGCAELVVSATGIVRSYEGLRKASGANVSGTTGKDLGRILSTPGDPENQSIEYANAGVAVEMAMQDFSVGLGTLDVITFADVHVIGGGFANIGPFLLERAKFYARQRGIASWGRDLASMLVLGHFPDDAGYLGSAIYAEVAAHKAAEQAEKDRFEQLGRAIRNDLSYEQKMDLARIHPELADFIFDVS